MFGVLVVEDEDIIRKGIAYGTDWESVNCHIVGEACNGKEGIEKIISLKPDIVLTDIVMPLLNGIEMIRQAKEKADFKCILLTSYAEFTYAKQAIDLQVSGYLMKPVEEEELLKLVERITGQLQKEQESSMPPKEKSNEEKILMALPKQALEHPHIAEVLKMTKEHYAEKISIESIAAEIGVSSSYLSRKFKLLTGMTYLDFLNQYRIGRSVSLLKTGKYRVYEVSELVGYTDYKHFSMVFKRYTGQAPSDLLR